MAFFKKLKERLFKSSSKIDEGLEAIVEDGGTIDEAPIDTDAQEAEERRVAEERAEEQRRAAEAQAEEERRAAEEAETRRLAEERAEAERLAQAERDAAERRAAEAKQAAEEADRLRREQEAAAAAEAERVRQQEEAARLDAERRAEEDARRAAEQAERDRQEREELERQQRERAEQERAAAQAAQAKLDAEAAERAKQEAEAAERARLEAEQAERARLEAEQAERARVEQERLAAERAEQERLAAERAARDREAAEAAQREADRLAAEAAERARLEEEQRAAAAEQARLDEERRAAEAEQAAKLEAERHAQAAAERARQEERAAEEAAAAQAAKPGLLGRLFGRKEQKTVVRRELDDDMLEQLEELLIASDMGVDTALRVTANMAEGRFGKRLSVEEIKQLLSTEIARIMEPVAKPLPLFPKTPQVVLVVGVNGSGKTTTIGKLASQFRAAGKKVVIAAGDTFRAAAVEQLQVWGERAGVPVLTAPEGTDPASLAFDAMAQAQRDGADLLMIDTAGRLQNRSDLMEELAKIVRVIRKHDETAPHNTLLVLDATTGQNALNQVKVFQEVSDVSGLVMTKLDGTAKGGVLVALADKFGLPIHAIGVGEQIDDLAPFDPEEFAAALTGLQTD